MTDPVAQSDRLPPVTAGAGPAAALSTRGFRGYKFPVALPADHFYVFVSSPGDCKAARKQVRALLYDAYNPALMSAGERAFLVPIMWEDALAQRVEGQSPNDVFVETALNCHAALVLLKTRLGTGTREEVEQLLAVPPEERKVLSVVRFSLAPGEEPEEDPKPLDDFVHTIGTKEKVLYSEPGPIESHEAHIELSKILNGYMLAALDASKRMERTDAP